MARVSERPAGTADSRLGGRPAGPVRAPAAEVGAYAGLTALGLGLRLYDLGSRALHHDESLHALFAWYLYQGRGYSHDPMMHGPFQFHALALIYFLFGDSDATARLLAALCGTALIGACYWLRPWLGRFGALAAALLLTFSPVMLYFSRFARNDIIIALWDLLIVLGLWGYLAGGRPASLVLAAAGISLGFATKEVTFITVAIFGVFFGLRLLRELLEIAGPDPAAALGILGSTTKAPRFLGPLVVLAGLALPQFSAGVELPAAWLGFGPLARSAAYPPAWVAGVAGALAAALVGLAFGAALLGLRPGLTLGIAALPFGLALAIAPGLPASDPLAGALFNLVLYGLFAAGAWVIAGRPGPVDLGLTAAGAGLMPALVFRTAGTSAGIAPAWAGLVVTTLLGLTAGGGLLWNRRLWPVLLGVFYTPYVLLYTTFFTNLAGFGSGIWGSLQYWLLQHEVQRGAQPWYYYLLLLPIYEFLPILLALLGVVIWSRQSQGVRFWAASVAAATVVAFFVPGGGGRLGALALLGAGLGVLGLARGGDLVGEFRLFLLFWTVASFVGYAIAGEKMPWLGVHLTLPLILTAGRSIQDLLSGLEIGELRDSRPWIAGLAALLTVLGLVGLFRALGERPDAVRVGALALASLGFGLVGWWAGRNTARPALLAGVGAVMGLILFGLTVRAAVLASYYNGDTPVEMLVYTQTSPAIPRLLRQVEEIAARTGQGRDLPITVDATSGFSWPWAWYLRYYRNVEYPTLSSPAGPPRGAVLFLHASNEQAMRPYLDRYGPGQRYPHRWWFPEDYKSAAEWIRAVTPPDQRDQLIFDPASPPGLREALAATFQPSALGRLWRYFLYRETLNPLGSEDGIFYVARDLSTPGPPAVGANSSSNLNVVSRFGQAGSNPGEFNAPRAIAVGPDGSIYVADSLNHRVQKFDSAGRFLAQVGGQGTGPGQFQEPWGVAVGPDGSVYVADTWNHRVQKFDPNLKFVAAWGGFATAGPDPQAVPGRFYGPRDVAVDGSGRVFVTDTGNKRIQVFGPDGQFLLVLGGPGSEPGRFNEPVGLKFDGAGRLWVADTWNRRVQVFDAELRPIAQIPVPGWNGTGIENKPYLAVGPDGSVWATDPEGGRLLRFDPGFRLVGSFTGPFALPAGVAVDAGGQLLVTDRSANRVLRLRQPDG